MKLNRITSLLVLLVAFGCTLALVGWHRNASKAAQSSQGAGSHVQAAPTSAIAQAQSAAASAQSPNSQRPAGNRPAPAASVPPADVQTTQPAPVGRPVVPDQSAQTGTATADNSAGNEAPQVTIPNGTPVEIRLTQSLSSAGSASGQSFAASLDAPIVVGNTVVVPRGANVMGRVLYAKRSGRLKGPAELTLTLTSLELSGQDYSVVTGHKSWRGKSHKKRNLAWIGGGGAAGSLVGVAAGGGVGAAIGAGVGAGGGTIAAFVTGRKNIVLPSETRLYFVLRKPLMVSQS